MRFAAYLAPCLLGLLTAAVPAPASAAVEIGIAISAPLAPPPLPVYVQPPIPEPGFIWTPGYWAYGPVGGYYWVPGTWVQPPAVGLLWTPPWWGFSGGVYGFHAGYWGPHVGFYGGINYGFGYGGVGFVGGRWDHGVFAYNGFVTNFGAVRIANVYREPVIAGPAVRVSFNGGVGGIRVRATAEQEAFAREEHVPPSAEQARHFEAAAGNPAFRASVNHGRPAMAATARPGEFGGHAAAVRGGPPRGGERAARAGEREGRGKEEGHERGEQR
jgi:hypothetical protein